MKKIAYLLIMIILFCKQTAEASCGACYFPHESRVKDQSTGSISSGPMINSPTASSLGTHHVSGGFAFNYLRFNAIPAENAHELHHDGRDVHGKRHEEIYNTHLGYGMTDRWDIYVSAPVVSKTSVEIHGHRELGRKGSSVGFGDMRLINKYRLTSKIAETAVIAGIKFPTGKTSDKNRTGEKFEAEQQPGSGSWDGEFGFAVSRSFKKHLSLATSVQYALRGEGAQEHKLGDVLIYNVAASYAVKEIGSQPNVSMVIEVNNKWAFRDYSREEDQVFDSGGTTIFISPGFVIDMTKNFSAFLTVPIPAYQNLGGEHEELSFEMLTGVNFHF